MDFFQIFNKAQQAQIEADNAIRKAQLLREFYSSMRLDTMKLEVKDNGFNFLDIILNGGTRLEYGELKGLIPKYKLTNINPVFFHHSLLHHVKKNCNVCMYFNEQANSVFAYNLDSRDKDNKYNDEMKSTLVMLERILNDVGIEPLIYISGRGYHIWTRCNEPIENKKLFDFMKMTSCLARYMLKKNNVTENKVDIALYPTNTTNTNSLRLFGSEHIKNKVFSRVCTKDRGVLNEYDSWVYFEEYMHNKTITKEQFEKAYKIITDTFNGHGLWDIATEEKETDKI